jgi:hypothetical protein
MAVNAADFAWELEELIAALDQPVPRLDWASSSPATG